MRLLVNGDEWEGTRDPHTTVTRLKDRLLVRTAEGEFTALAVRMGRTCVVSYKGRQYRVEPMLSRRSAAHQTDGGEVLAPMPCQIVEVACMLGDTVQKGQRLAVLEAMKMQLPILSPRDGRVVSLDAKAGGQVVEGQTLVFVGEVDP